MIKNFKYLFYDFFVNKKTIKILLKECLIFLVQIAFSRVQFGQVFALGFSFALSRVFFGGNLLLIAAEYVISNLFLIFDFYAIISVMFEVVVLTLYYYFKEMFKFKRKKLILFLFAGLSCAVELYFLIAGKMIWQSFLIKNILKLLFLAYFLKIYAVYQKKFIFLRCSNLDYLMFSVFLMLFVLGLFSYDFLARSIGICLFFSVILISCRFLPVDKFLIFSITLSFCFGYIFSSIKLIVFSVFFIVLLTSISRLFKYLYLSIVLALFLIGFKFLGDIGLPMIISLTTSVLITMIIPQKIINKLADFFEEKNIDIIKENIWIEKEKEIKQNLTLMSKTLFKMQSDFKFLIVGKIDRRCASNELVSDITAKCCEKCEHRKLCDNSLIDKKHLLAEYIYFAINNRGISIDDLSVGFKTYCSKTGLIVSEIKSLSEKFIEFEASMKSEDESKLLISTELENFANLFQNFAKNIEKSPKINKNLSEIAKEMLKNNMLEVSDIAVFENKNGIEKIDVVAENNVMLRRELSAELSKLVHSKVQIRKLKHLDYSGLSLVSFVVASSLKAEFTVATSSKEEVSGDNVMISRIDDNRFFIAIADGMGHGKVAGRTSKMVLELIRNLFFIGIDLNLIIDSINKLLLPVGFDNFSTLDAVVVDLKLAKCTFIKLGSSVSAIKHKEKTELILSDSLPVGIVQNLKPTIIVKPIQVGDVIVIASDGVVDCFDDSEEYKIFINDSKIEGLQRFADNVIFELGMTQKGKRDDMSIIALKLLKNSLK